MSLWYQENALFAYIKSSKFVTYKVLNGMYLRYLKATDSTPFQRKSYSFLFYCEHVIISSSVIIYYPLTLEDCGSLVLRSYYYQLIDPTAYEWKGDRQRMASEYHKTLYITYSSRVHVQKYILTGVFWAWKAHVVTENSQYCHWNRWSWKPKFMGEN